MSRRKKRLIRKDWPRVRRVTVRGQERFIVDGRPHKERRFFKNEQDAAVQADVWARERTNQGIEALSFPTELRMEAIKATKRLSEYGKKIGDAVEHYVRWLDEERQKHAALLVDVCLDEWIRSKEAEFKAGHLRPTTIQELRSRSKFFQAAFGRQRIRDIDEAAIETFLAPLPHAPRGKFNIRLKLSQFLNYCRRRKWIKSNPAELIQVRVPAEDIVAFRPAEAEQLLRAAENSSVEVSVMPYLIVSLFAGLRPGEGEQLRWENIHFGTKEIEVLAPTSKVKETRFVPMNQVLLRWLSRYRRRHGAIIGKRFSRDLRMVKKIAGYGPDRKWVTDVLRHTFGSHWLAKYKDRARLAEIMGTSVEMIKKSYKRAVPIQEWKGYWALRPSRQKKNSQ
jgi:integrase